MASNITTRAGRIRKAGPAGTNCMYKILRGYKAVQIWTCDPVTRRRICAATTRPNPTFSRRNRWLVIVAMLKSYGIPAPAYVETAKERVNLQHSLKTIATCAGRKQ